MRNFKMTLCYDGTRYRGWQKQGNTPDTIQAKLETLLSRLLEQDIEVAGSGRTDAGVHARAQVASFHADTALRCDQLLPMIRSYLPADIGLLSIEEAPPRFHARLSAKRKTYVYRIWNSTLPCVFERRYVFLYPEALDTAAMERAAGYLCGQHDFTAFSSGRKTGKAATRTIDSIELSRVGEELQLRFTGDGFLYNMVRTLTGTLLEVGAGKRTPESIESIFAAGKRSEAGFLAPSSGLFLEKVEY